VLPTPPRLKLRAAFDACCAIDLAPGGAPIGFDRGACASKRC